MEKLKNLIFWKSPSSTIFVLAGLCIVYLVVTFIPLRIIITLGVVQKFMKGYRYYYKVKGKRFEQA